MLRRNARTWTTALALLFAPACASSWGGSTWIQIDGDQYSEVVRDGDQLNCRFEDSHQRFQAEVIGDLEFDLAGTTLERIPAGSRLNVRGHRAGAAYQLTATAGPGEQPQLSFTRDGVEQALDADGQEWLSGVVAQLSRLTTLGVAARSRRTLAAGGPEALFAELDHYPYSAARSLALDILLDEPGLPTQLLLDLVAYAERQLSSESARADRLLEIARAQPMDRGLSQALISAFAAMDSSYQQSKGLEQLVQTRRLESTDIVSLLHACGRIDSDSSRRQSLEAVAEVMSLDAEVIEAYCGAVDGMDSSFERGQALEALADRKPLPTESLARLYRCAGEIPSANTARQSLNQLLRAATPDDAASLVWLDQVDGLDSSYERGQALEAFAAHAPRSVPVYTRALGCAAATASDSTAAEAMIRFIARAPADQSLFRTVLDLVDEIDSEYYQGQVLKALLERPELDATTLQFFHRVTEGLRSGSLRNELQGELLDRLVEAG